MIRGILLKEWKENRRKYAALWLAYNTPAIALALLLGLAPGTRATFADLGNATVMKYLPLTLGESWLICTVLLLATALAAVAAFRPEAADRGMFFVFEQPVSRKLYAATAVLGGGVAVAAAVSCAILLAPAVAYAMMLISGKITFAGSAAAFGLVLRTAARGLLWCSLVSMAAFAGSALISTVSKRWWLAAPGAIALVVLLGSAVHADNHIFGGGDFFDFVPAPDGTTYSVSVNFPDRQWVKVSSVLPPPASYAPFRPLSLLLAAALIAAFTTGVAVLYERKELK